MIPDPERQPDDPQEFKDSALLFWSLILLAIAFMVLCAVFG